MTNLNTKLKLFESLTRIASYETLPLFWVVFLCWANISFLIPNIGILAVIFFPFVICAAYALNIKLNIVIDDYLPFKLRHHIPFQFLETFILACILGNLLQIISI